MTKEELIAYLRENLSVSVTEEFSRRGDAYAPIVRVKLVLENEVISSDWFDLPKVEP